MPYPNEHSCRLHPPGGYETFRRVSPGVRMIHTKTIQSFVERRVMVLGRIKHIDMRYQVGLQHRHALIVADMMEHLKLRHRQHK